MKWCVAVLVVVGGCLEGGAMSYEAMVQKAEGLAGRVYEGRRSALPEWMVELNYDEYRRINYRRESALWTGDTRFGVEFFHPGYLFTDPVDIFVDDERWGLEAGDFDYRDGRPEVAADEDKLGLGGFRVLSKFGGDEWKEVAIFQGASYWRAVSGGLELGLSARGVAVATGELEPEEFPVFQEFYLSKPEAGVESMMVVALLDGPSLTGAYEFIISPGAETTIKVRSTLFARRDVKRVGIGAMSSMFWYSPAFPHEKEDERPAVHDSDGLAVLTQDGAALWKPLTNQRSVVELSVLEGEDVQGYGLLQRRRDGEGFADNEARYERRVSLWIEPQGEPWGEGNVVLVEIPSDSEYVDNMAAMWEPRGGMRAGESRAFCYEQKWASAFNPAGAKGVVYSSAVRRTAVGVVVQLEVELENSPEPVDFSALKLEVAATVHGKKSSFFVNVDRIGLSNVVTASFELAHLKKSNSHLPTEWRCTLLQADKPLSESWLYSLHR